MQMFFSYELCYYVNSGFDVQTGHHCFLQPIGVTPSMSDTARQAQEQAELKVR